MKREACVFKYQCFICHRVCRSNAITLKRILKVQKVETMREMKCSQGLMTSSETRHLFHCHFSGHRQAWCRGPSPLKLSGEKILGIRSEKNSKHESRTCRHVLYLANNSSQSVDLVLPRMYSGLLLAILKRKCYRQSQAYSRCTT